MNDKFTKPEYKQYQEIKHIFRPSQTNCRQNLCVMFSIWLHTAEINNS